MHNQTRRKFFDTPPLRYVGAKWQVAEWIIAQFPPHEVYCEPFAGSAAIFFRKHPSDLEVLNDLDGELINFFDVLRNRPQALIRAIQLTPWSRAEYQRSYEPVRDPISEEDFQLLSKLGIPFWSQEEDTAHLALERARRFYVRANQSFASTQIYKSGWRYQRTPRQRSSVTKTWARTDGLYDAAYRLRDAQIDCLPALEVIEHHDSPETLFYVDPPYVLKARAGKRRYAYEMEDADHREMAARLHHVKGMVILSGYRSDLYEELYPEWTQVHKTTTTNGNGLATETLWLSPNTVALNALPLFQEVSVD